MSSNTALALKGQASEAQIQDWKSKYPDGVHAVKLFESSKVPGQKGKPFAVIYFREPDDSDYAMIMALLTDKQVVKAGEIALQTLKIGGYDVTDTDKKMYRTACTAAIARLDYYETEAEKL